LQTSDNPVFVKTWRGDHVENKYRGMACVTTSGGGVEHRWGDIDALVYPRSSIKPIQAIPFLELGAAAAHGASDGEVALACASHSGESAHRETVNGFLDRIGLSPARLECGTHEPFSPIVARDLIVERRNPTVLYHNCSGQHASFLALARHLGAPTPGYVKRDHPVQEAVGRVISELCDVDVRYKPCGTDGCGVPTFAIPLRSLALGMARLGDQEGLPDKRGMACAGIFRAMTAQPYLVGGSGRFDTLAMEAGRGRFIVKTGAMGVYTASIPDLGLGVALKVESGDKDASETAILAILKFLGVLDPKAEAALAPFLSRPITTATGVEAGVTKPAEGFPV